MAIMNQVPIFTSSVKKCGEVPWSRWCERRGAPGILRLYSWITFQRWTNGVTKSGFLFGSHFLSIQSIPPLWPLAPRLTESSIEAQYRAETRTREDPQLAAHSPLTTDRPTDTNNNNNIDINNNNNINSTTTQCLGHVNAIRKHGFCLSRIV